MSHVWFFAVTVFYTIVFDFDSGIILSITLITLSFKNSVRIETIHFCFPFIWWILTYSFRIQQKRRSNTLAISWENVAFNLETILICKKWTNLSILLSTSLYPWLRSGDVSNWNHKIFLYANKLTFVILFVGLLNSFMLVTTWNFSCDCLNINTIWQSINEYRIVWTSFSHKKTLKRLVILKDCWTSTPHEF